MSSSNVTSIVSSNNNLFVVQLQLISQYLTIALGSTIFIGGTIGNLLNILVFLSMGNYRRNPCSLYMLAGSISDTIIVVTGLSTRILSQGFQIDLAIRSQVWCKLRYYILATSGLCAFTCICLESIDTCLATSRSPIWRQKSNIRTARYLLIGFVCFWLCHGTVLFYFADLTTSNNATLPTCVIVNTVYSQYLTYFSNTVLSLTIPFTIIIVFGFLTYRNLRTLNVREGNPLSSLTKQMTRMALAQLSVVCLCQGPFAISQAYFLATTYVVKNASQKAQELVVNTFFAQYNFINYASPFYCYYTASKPFREQVASAVRLITRRRNNQVTSFGEMRLMATTQQQAITSLALSHEGNK